MVLSLEVMPDAGAPQVGVTVSGLPSGTPSVVTVQRSTNGVTWETVRGADRGVMVGAGFVRDFVPPLNVAVTYRLVTDAEVTGGTSAVITVESDSAWLQDPLDPRSAVPVTWHHGDSGSVQLLSQSAATIAHRQPIDTVTPQGARLPVASIGTRQAPAGVLLQLRALAAAQGALVKDLRDLFDRAGTVVVRGLPQALPIDAVAHVVAPDLSESAVVGGAIGIFNDWVFEVMQVRAPSPRISVPWWTYDQVAALWSGATYDDVLAARPGDTYLDWLRDPTPEAS